jgi:hypothetical protein
MIETLMQKILELETANQKLVLENTDICDEPHLLKK